MRSITNELVDHRCGADERFVRHALPLGETSALIRIEHLQVQHRQKEKKGFEERRAASMDKNPIAAALGFPGRYWRVSAPGIRPPSSKIWVPRRAFAAAEEETRSLRENIDRAFRRPDATAHAAHD